MVTFAPSVISTSEPSAITRPPVVSLMVSEPPAGLSVSSVSVSAVSVFSTPPLMVSLVFAPSLVPEPSLAPSPPTRMPSILTLSLEISCPPPSVTLSIASEPSIVLSPLRVISTSELSRALMPAVAFSVRLILVLSSVRSTLVSLLSSSSFRFTPISMPLPPVVRLESLTVRSTSAPSPTLMMVLSSLASAGTPAGGSVWVLVSTFTPSTTMVAPVTSSLTVMVFVVVVSDVELFSVLLPEASVDCVSLSVGMGTSVPLLEFSELSVVGGTSSFGALPSMMLITPLSAVSSLT